MSEEKTVASPCRQICELGADQICEGCGRTLDEIAEWPEADNQRRRKIAGLAAQRISTNKIFQMSSEHTIEQFSRRIQMPVRWGDMDTIGHVNNAKFFTYDESGRIGYFEELMQGDPRFWKEYGIILARISADFIAQLHYPATLEIGTRITRFGRSSMNTLSAMFSEGQLICVTQGVVVWYDYNNQKAVPIPEFVREQIRSREIVKPE